MTRIFAAVLVALVVSGPAWGNVSGSFTNYYPGYQKCSEYLGDYATAETKDTETGIEYPFDAALALGWMMGYISGVNENVRGKKDFFRMQFSEVAAWVASWCRDNPDKKIFNAMDALYKSRNKIIIEDDD